MLKRLPVWFPPRMSRSSRRLLFLRLQSCLNPLIYQHLSIQGVQMIRKVTKLIEEFQVEEKPLNSLKKPNLDVIRGVVVQVDTTSKVCLFSDVFSCSHSQCWLQTVMLGDGTHIAYDKLCVCTGSVPKARFCLELVC